MLIATLIAAILISATNLSIVEPIDGETYNGDWLTVRAIVENENEVADSVHYSINSQPVVQIPRLNTDWYTYMQNDLHHGFSESPAPTDNTILWTAPVTGDYHEFPTPVIVDGIVYYPSNYGTDSLYALDSATGELIWKYRTGSTDDAVTVKNGYLYTASDSLWCLNALTGERIWANGDADWSGSTPAVVNGMVYAGRWQLAQNISYVYCFDAATGAEIWADTLSGNTASCMTVWNGMVFIPTCIGPLYALETNTGSIIWKNTDANNGYWDSSPVVVDSLIYISGMDGSTLGIDALTGITVWEVSTSPGGSISATPAYHDGRLYFGNEIDTFHCLDASNGTTVWSVPGWQHGSSGIADGIVFYGENYNYGKTFNRDDPRVVALDCDTGEEIWSYETIGNIYSSPAITDGIVYIAVADWNLYAFGTGLKYTYLDDLFAEVGSNELIVTSFDGGVAVAADTINFTVTQTGITLEPSSRLALCASPNPFYSTASISFELSEPGWTLITVYDLSGRIIYSLNNSELAVGEHSIQWDGSNQNGESVSAGLYFCRIQSGGISETTGLCLLR